MKKTLILLTLLITAFIPLNCFATDYFFSTSGDDSKTCTSQSEPCQSLSKIETLSLNPGDMVLLRRGDVWESQHIYITQSGTSASPITIADYGTGNKPVIDLQDTNCKDNPEHPPYAINIQGSYVTVESLVLTGGKYPTKMECGEDDLPSAYSKNALLYLGATETYCNTFEGIVVRNVEFLDTKMHGIYTHPPDCAGAGVRNGIIENCVFDSTNVGSGTYGSCSGRGNCQNFDICVDADGIPIEISGQSGNGICIEKIYDKKFGLILVNGGSHIVRNCRFEGLGQVAISLWGSSGNQIINNEIANNKGNAINIVASVNTIIEENLMKNNGGYPWFGTPEWGQLDGSRPNLDACFVKLSGTSTFRYNIILGQKRSWEKPCETNGIFFDGEVGDGSIYGNVIGRNDGAGIAIIGVNNRVFNNIIFENFQNPGAVDSLGFGYGEVGAIMIANSYCNWDAERDPTPIYWLEACPSTVCECGNCGAKLYPSELDQSECNATTQCPVCGLNGYLTSRPITIDDVETTAIVENNIFYDNGCKKDQECPQVGIIAYDISDFAKSEFRNNIYWIPGNANGDNAFKDDTKGGLLSWDGWRQLDYPDWESGSNWTDPLFKDVDNFDFTLLQCSPCISNGIQVGDPGSGWDLLLDPVNSMFSENNIPVIELLDQNAYGSWEIGPFVYTPVEIIIDNGDAGTSWEGAWTVSRGDNPYGENSLYAYYDVSSYSYVTNADGLYEVALWWSYYRNRCTEVPVEIYDGETLIESVTVNQQNNAGQWNVIGSYVFSGTAKVIILHTQDNCDSCSTCADAVRFTEVLDQPPSMWGPLRIMDTPLGWAGISTDPDNPSNIFAGEWAGGLVYFDDYVCCGEEPTSTYEYREYNGEFWIERDEVTYLRVYDAVYFHLDPAMAGDGPYEFRQSVTDCTGQKFYSDVHYIQPVSCYP